MNRFLAVPLALLAAPALAHPGHLAEEAGHNHGVALGAAALAVTIVAIGAVRALLKRRRAAHG